MRRLGLFHIISWCICDTFDSSISNEYPRGIAQMTTGVGGQAGSHIIPFGDLILFRGLQFGPCVLCRG